MNTDLDIPFIKGQITQLHTKASTRHESNYRWWWWLIILSLILSFFIIALGVYDKGQIAAVLSALNIVVIGLNTAFAFGDDAQFYRVVATEANLLIEELAATKSPSPEDALSVFQRYQALQRHMSEKVPLGQGMDAAIKIHDAMKRDVK